MATPREMTDAILASIQELKEQIVKTNQDRIDAEHNYTLALAEIQAMKDIISDLDMRLRTELSWAGIFPSTLDDLQWSVTGIIKEYKKLKK